LNDTVQILRSETENAIYWFRINSLIANPEKFQFMILGRDCPYQVDLNIDGKNLNSTQSVKLLGVTIDCKLNFKMHVHEICKNASQKTKALFRIRPYLNIDCAKKLCNAYILSIFNYCPLIWMYGCKSNNTLVNKVHKRALSAVYHMFDLTLDELLKIWWKCKHTCNQLEVFVN